LRTLAQVPVFASHDWKVASMSEIESRSELGLFEELAQSESAIGESGPLATPTAVERAFELARGGGYVTIEQIGAQLKAEQHEAVDEQLFDPQLRRALRQACVEGRQAVGRP
jgi:hypothetical protein